MRSWSRVWFWPIPPDTYADPEVVREYLEEAGRRGETSPRRPSGQPTASSSLTRTPRGVSSDRNMDRTAESDLARARASGWELVGALIGTVVLIPPVFLFFLLGAADIAEQNPGISEIALLAGTIGLTLAAWVVAVVLFIRHWRGGWKRLWSLPLVVLGGVLFFPSLLLLFSSSFRGDALPYKPVREARPKELSRRAPR